MPCWMNWLLSNIFYWCHDWEEFFAKMKSDICHNWSVNSICVNIWTLLSVNYLSAIEGNCRRLFDRFSRWIFRSLSCQPLFFVFLPRLSTESCRRYRSTWRAIRFPLFSLGMVEDLDDKRLLPFFSFLSFISLFACFYLFACATEAQPSLDRLSTKEAVVCAFLFSLLSSLWPIFNTRKANQSWSSIRRWSLSFDVQPGDESSEDIFGDDFEQ